ncbi:putative quinol monooxygenase [Acinetobacter sp. NIPH 298]|uniref:putative quinol monooxygenase n=1 Tax=Acinetobacter sp. NIPH 298 TaxID=1217692 RepID=UPI0002CDE096|nr:putative quinol monooxygenase [Acinetobacter sp. NIPH 298]ENW93744.1 hypothetical protein F903_03175 [Acinetobacter sp. NIPH 298]
MITLNVFFNVNSEKRAEFLNVLNNMVVESNKEQGCLIYKLWQDTNAVDSYVLIELWENKEVLSKHQQTPHWIAFNDVVNSYLTEPYDEHHYQEIAH